MLMEILYYALLLWLAFSTYRLLAYVSVYNTINRRSRPTSPKQRLFIPLEISWGELARFWLYQEPSYLIRYFIEVPSTMLFLYFFPAYRKHITEEHVVEFLANTTMFVDFKQVERRNISYGATDWSTDTWHVLSYDKMGLAHRPNQRTGSLFVRMDLPNKRIDEFRFHGGIVTSPNRMLEILTYVDANYSHPITHSFLQRWRESARELPPKYWRMNGWAPYINEAGLGFPAYPLIGWGDVNWQAEFIGHNSLRTPHCHHEKDVILYKHSPFYRFCFDARVIVFEELERAGLNYVDKEAYFIGSVVHSLDHYSGHIALRGGTYFDGPLEGDPHFHHHNMFHRLFFPPVVHRWLGNNLLSCHYEETELYTRLYQRLAALDPVLAKQVTLAISS